MRQNVLSSTTDSRSVSGKALLVGPAVCHASMTTPLRCLTRFHRCAALGDVPTKHAEPVVPCRISSAGPSLVEPMHAPT